MLVNWKTLKKNYISAKKGDYSKWAKDTDYGNKYEKKNCVTLLVLN